MLAVDGFLPDEFGGTNFPLIHAVLEGLRIILAPQVIVDYARNGHLTHEVARTLITTISSSATAPSVSLHWRATCGTVAG